jgi:phosphoglycolate phosphatase-like HAD superfamily hydrolase
MAVVIFDFDGTVADSFDFVAGYLIKASGKKSDPELVDSLRNLSMLAMARTVGVGWLRLPRLFIHGRKDMRKGLKKVQPFAGMSDVIRKVHAEGHEVFMLSSNSVSTLHKFLHQHELHTYFLELYGGVSIFGKAPALKRLIKENNLNIEDCIYVGDETRDIQASKYVGMRIISVTWGFARVADLKKLKPTALVDTPEELMTKLEEI